MGAVSWVQAPSPEAALFHRVFRAEKDLPLTFARQLMVLAPNLQAVTLGVWSLKCPACLAARRKRPGLAASRRRLAEGSEHVDVDAFVRLSALMDLYIHSLYVLVSKISPLYSILPHPFILYIIIYPLYPL
jgi:hypothetical protein